MTTSYDLVVLGAGSGGMAGAKRAARHGASVAVVEERTAGGTCVARGCMPKKFLVIASELAMDARADGPRGLETSLKDVTWADLIDHEQAVVDDLVEINRDGIEDYDNIDYIDGRGQLVDERTVAVDDRWLEADRIFLATGLRPSQPPIDGVEHGQTSDEFLRDRTLPDSVVIVGGGYIGVEFGSVLRAFGTDVEIIHRPSHLVKQHDCDVADHLRDELEKRAVQISTDTEVQGIDSTAEGYRVHYETGDGQTGSTGGERVLVATGRRPNTEDIGLEEAGVETDRAGFVEVDDHHETSTDGIYAVGDITGEHRFTPVAIREGKMAADHAFGSDVKPLDYDTVPTAVFTHPEIGSVGLSEEEARSRYDQIRVATKQFKPYSSTVKGSDSETFVKLLYEGASDRLIGMHVLGPSASDLIQGFAVAMKRDIGLDDFRDFPGVHPTVAEEVFSTKP